MEKLYKVLPGKYVVADVKGDRGRLRAVIKIKDLKRLELKND